MIENKTYISFGDVTDLYYKIKQQGVSPLLSKLHLSNQARTVSKWNAAVPTADFWIIPEIRLRWNEKCTGNPDLEYEDYFVGKYLSGKEGLKMLSVGCGTGARERKFGKYPRFRLIEGIDVADKVVNEARKQAESKGLNNLRYIAGDFEKQPWEVETYDVILFNSSLHHFAGIDNLLRDKVRPLLKEGGYLVIHEYVGPNKLQWTMEQLHFANQLLNELPEEYKIRFKSNVVKRRIYRPGLIRMLLSDPSEAIDSESIVPAVHKHFRILEEKKLGWDITHLLFKDIAHNFLREDNDTKELLAYLFAREDEYMALTGRSDAIFGIYRKQGEAT